MSMISIKCSNIPKWLHAGDFYRNLNPDDLQDIIDIPADCFAEDDNWTADKNNEQDFCQLVRVAMYWMLDEIPVGVLEFCFEADAKIWQSAVLSVPGAKESSIFKPLFGVYPLVKYRPFDIIVSRGKWELIVHAVGKMKDSGNKEATAVAAELGNLTVLKYLHEQGLEWSNNTCVQASQYGHLDCLQYALENGCPWDNMIFNGAAKNGHLHIMKYLLEQGLHEWNVDVCYGAAEEGQLACLQFAHVNGCPWDTWTACKAAQNGHLNCLKYAHENGCPWDSTAVIYAAQHGHLVCLQYLLEQSCPTHEEACARASEKGHLPCLHVLHAFGAPWRETACFYAAKHYLDTSCLQFLHEHGCPWDERTLYVAAEEGNLDALRYAMERGCRYEAYVLLFAARGGSLECLQYLVEDQLVHMNESVFITALLMGDLACLQYLLDQGCPFLRAVFSTYKSQVQEYDRAFTDHFQFTQCVRYAVERGWRVNYAFCHYISTRDLECENYLRSEGLFVAEEEEEEELNEEVEEQIDEGNSWCESVWMW